MNTLPGSNPTRQSALILIEYQNDRFLPRLRAESDRVRTFAPSVLALNGGKSQHGRPSELKTKSVTSEREP